MTNRPMKGPSFEWFAEIGEARNFPQGMKIEFAIGIWHHKEPAKSRPLVPGAGQEHQTGFDRQIIGADEEVGKFCIQQGFGLLDGCDKTVLVLLGKEGGYECRCLRIGLQDQDLHRGVE